MPYKIILNSIRQASVCFVLCLLTVCLSGCGWLMPKHKPKLNPHPKYFVTITGNIQPHMPYPMTIIFKATYAAYHPKCGVWISRFEGVKGLAGHLVYYPAKPNAQGNYKVKIPIDGYLPGKCDWKMAWVMFSFVKQIPPASKYSNIDNAGDIIRFGRKGSLEELPEYPMKTHATIYCYKGGLEKCTGHSIQGDYANSVPRKRSYHFVQNIKIKKDKK